LDGLSRRQSGDVAPTQPLNGSTLSLSQSMKTNDRYTQRTLRLRSAALEDRFA